ncbi:hypothetical protein [Kocuria tytonis]|uniref:Uncharacterized protein n=1 Tax=Kocuria tytonis TaxID=2054280 RepID=A0A495A5U1_9MICC|nr:hypothetical protein [Kocuria tytonis]RKQ35208.1 hypothetical protein C1C97_008160 [Kocuria tytonis]
MSTETFDVRAYMRSPIVLTTDEVDAVAHEDVSESTLPTLTYLWSVEQDTLARMRDLLVTPTHAESRITAFLSTWSHEQHRVARGLQKLLEANGCTPREPPDSTAGRARRVWDDRFRPIATAVGANFLGNHVVGAQMAAGWLDAAVLASGYHHLGAAHAPLAPLARTVVRQKERHMQFFAQETRGRLEDDRVARGLARVAVRRWRAPGTRYADPRVIADQIGPLLTDSSVLEALDAADRTVQTWPGLTGARPVRAGIDELRRAGGGAARRRSSSVGSWGAVGGDLAPSH